MSHPKRQHYVPQFLLRAFADPPGSGKLNVFDKKSDRSFSATTRSVGAEKRFYDLKFGDEVWSLESSLGECEGRASSILREIAIREEIGFLTDQQKGDLATFVVLQHFRTKHFRESMAEVNRLLASALDEMDPGSAARLGLEEPSEEEAQALALHHLQMSVEFTPYVLSKAWILYEAPSGSCFWIGDHPVVMSNTANQDPLRGTIGWAVQGIEIYLPISPQFCLAFLCPTLRQMFDTAYDSSARVKTQLGVEIPNHDSLGATRDGFSLGFAVPSHPENVVYMNSLQVIWSERFVFSSTPDFELVSTMLVANPQNRIGPRPTLG